MAELSPERRVLIAFALSFLVLAVWSSYMRSRYPPEEAPPEPPAVAQPAPAEAEPAAPVTPELKEAKPVLEEAKQAGAERTLTVESDKATIVFSNRGAQVRSWTLKDYEDEAGGALDLVQGRTTGLGFPFALRLTNPQQEAALNQALFVVDTPTDHLEAPAELVFEWSDGELAARKHFRFHDGYLIEIETQVTANGEPLPHQIAWRGGFGDLQAVTARYQAKLVLRTPQKLRRHPAAQALQPTGWIFKSQPPFPYEGPAAYAGIEDRYFATVFFPPGAALRGTAATEQWTPEPTAENEKPKPQTVGSVALGLPRADANRFRVFVGPKDIDLLEGVGEQVQVPKLADELVDFGFFWWMAKPIFLAMKWLYERWIPNYGWVIVVLTLLINTALFPLKYKSLESSFKMQKLAPQMRAIQARYKQYKFNDPRKQEMQKETWALYKQHGVSPLGGCLPLLLQLPFFYGFFVVLSNAIELRHAPWMGWIQDLSQKDPYYVLPIFMGVFMYISMKMTPMSTPDPAQQRIMSLMPLIFTFLFLQFSAGLVLYWTVSSIAGSAQQWWINRRMRHRQEVEKLAAKEERKKKKKRRKQQQEAPGA